MLFISSYCFFVEVLLSHFCQESSGVILEIFSLSAGLIYACKLMCVFCGYIRYRLDWLFGRFIPIEHILGYI